MAEDNEDLWDPGSVFICNHFIANGFSDSIIEYRAFSISVYGYGNLFPRDAAWCFDEVKRMNIPDRLYSAGIMPYNRLFRLLCGSPTRKGLIAGHFAAGHSLMAC